MLALSSRRVALGAALVATILLGGPRGSLAARIAVLDAPGFVDTDGGFTAESDTLQASLASFGYEVSTFTATKAAGIAAALDGAAALAVPELENGDLAASLGAAARATIEAFVAAGGGLIIMGTSSERAPDLLNAVFKYNLSSGVVGPSTLMPGATGTGFEGGPSPLPDNLRTRGLDLVSLPPGARAIYVSGTRATVARFIYGSGRIVYLGWDWYAAAPLGQRDGGWLATLDSAASEATACALAAGGPDSDGDGIPDACDADDGCADVDGKRALGDGSRIVVKNEMGSEIANTLFIAADVFLPSGRVFADLDPLTLPLSLVVRAASGAVRVAETWPPRPFVNADNGGWHFEQKRKEWVYDDRSGTLTNGFVGVVLRDMSETQPGRVRVEIMGREGLYPIDAGDEPLDVLITLGDPAAGECGALAYADDECRRGVTGGRLICKH